MTESYCHCKRQCKTFAEHVGTGPYVTGSSMPTRSRAAELQRTETQWEKDGEAFKRLRAAGYEPPRLDGSAELEAKATQPIELEQGRLMGDKAKIAQKLEDSGLNAE